MVKAVRTQVRLKKQARKFEIRTACGATIEAFYLTINGKPHLDLTMPPGAKIRSLASEMPAKELTPSAEQA